jgi:hypothetical protein
MHQHFFCEGTCQGISSKVGVCQTSGCNKEGQTLTHCQCDKTEHKIKPSTEESSGISTA